MESATRVIDPSIIMSNGIETDFAKLDLDLELECVEEDLEEVQKQKHEDEARESRSASEEISKFKQQRHLISNTPNGLTIIGIPSRPPQPLTRPPQPRRSVPVTPPSILGPAFQGTSFNNQSSNASAAPRQSNANIIRQNRPIQITSVTGSGTYQPNNANVQRVAVTSKNNTLQGTTTGGITLQPGQVLNMNQFQPLLFDANSGLLLMPTTQGTVTSQVRGNASVNTVTSVSNATTYNRSSTSSAPVISSVYSQRGTVPAQNRTPSPRNPTPVQTMTVGSTTVRTSVSAANSQAPNRTYQTQSTPKIVGSTSLNPTATRPQRPTLTPAPRLPAPRPQALTGRPMMRPTRPPPLINKGLVGAGSATTMPPLRQVGGTTIRPIAQPAAVNNSQNQIQGMETTSTINGQSDNKDPNNNKTFPSLVVNVKPCLQERPAKAVINNARVDLDARVKNLLVYSTSKFTEWLMQQGLLRLEHRCQIHMTTDNEYIPYKLGMYSDAAKQPFSGGYVWISECCPDKQISVFQGSIFESAVYQPGTIVKLIYHWACQTSAPNVLQWVKQVTSYYLKNFYTLLRSCCVAALHEFCPMMGGPAKYVEVGIITLGSAVNQASNQKSVKIEILGVFDPASKVIRMKVLNPHNFAANSIHNRVSQILWPLNHWVHKSSCILIDSSIEKHLLTDMGFKTVLQCKSGGTVDGTAKGSPPTNVNVMNYLKHVVPKMFQNTLCVLSKSLIQQFLDELSWRELWGQTSASAYDTMISHLVSMTKWELDESLISRLNKISLNPFGEWGYTNRAEPMGIDALPDSIRNTGMPELSAQYGHGSNGYSSSSSGGNSRKMVGNSRPPVLKPQVPSPPTTNNGALKRKAIEMERNELRAYLTCKPKTVDLLAYYFNELPATTLPRFLSNEFPANLKCPLCSRTFLSNLEIMRHIYNHVTSMGRLAVQNILCDYCLKEMPSQTALQQHVSTAHKLVNSIYPCAICQEKFHNATTLILHMWETHCKADMPHKCETCDYRSARQTDVVDHFIKAHNGCDTVLCPLCLKVLPCKSFTCLKAIVVHVQSHTIRKGKKCPQCSLVFNHENEWRAHLAEGAHEEAPVPAGRSLVPIEFPSNPAVLMPVPPTVNRASRFAPPPPLKRARTVGHSTTSNADLSKRPTLKPSPSFLQGILEAEEIAASRNFNEHTFYYPPDFDLEGSEVFACCECGDSPDAPDHFPGWMNCSKCEFNTSCQPNMATHNRDVHPVGVPTQNLSCVEVHRICDMDMPLRCLCGFKSTRADTLLIHLQKCGYTSAFPLPAPIEEESDNEMPVLQAEGDIPIAADGKEPPNILHQLGLRRTD